MSDRIELRYNRYGSGPISVWVKVHDIRAVSEPIRAGRWTMHGHFLVWLSGVDGSPLYCDIRPQEHEKADGDDYQQSVDRAWARATERDWRPVWNAWLGGAK